jgi:hypothetical protein
MKTIILDRFPKKSAQLFLSEFGWNINVKIILLREDNVTELEGNENNKIYSDREISRGIGLGKAPWILSISEIKKFERHEGLFLSLLSRFDINGKNYLNEEKAEIYYKLINFWLFTIRSGQKVDVSFSYYAPHDPSSLALYLVNKFEKIPTIFRDMPYVLNKYQFFSCSYSERCLMLGHGRSVQASLINQFDRYAFAVRVEDPSAVPILTRRILDMTDRVRSDSILGVYRAIRGLFPISFRALLRGRFQRLPFHGTWWKVSRYAPGDPKSDYGDFGHRFAKIAYKIKVKMMQLKYRKRCEDHKKIRKFLYFAAPLQPEGATLPAALHARRLFPILKMISEALPENVVLAFKENPTLFSEITFYSFHWKTPYFYDELAALGNVVFIRDDIPTLDLIDASVGVACVNGSVAFESVIRGKHCLTFAPNWYDGLDGIHRVNTPQGVRAAIGKMFDGPPPIPSAEQAMVRSCYFDSSELSDPERHDRDMFAGLWQAYEVFGELDDRKWEI